jgi:hypothetical protein
MQIIGNLISNFFFKLKIFFLIFLSIFLFSHCTDSTFGSPGYWLVSMPKEFIDKEGNEERYAEYNRLVRESKEIALIESDKYCSAKSYLFHDAVLQDPKDWYTVKYPKKVTFKEECSNKYGDTTSYFYNKASKMSEYATDQLCWKLGSLNRERNKEKEKEIIRGALFIQGKISAKDELLTVDLEKAAKKNENLLFCHEAYVEIEFEKQVAEKKEYCKTIGYKDGTLEMSECALELISNDANIEAARIEAEAKARANKSYSKIDNVPKKSSINWSLLMSSLNQLNNSLYGGGSMSSTSTTCFSSGEYTKGMSKVCQYSCVGSAHAITVGAAQMCPVSVQR